MEPSNATTSYYPNPEGFVTDGAQSLATFINHGGVDPNGNVLCKTTGVNIYGTNNIILGLNGHVRPITVHGNYKLHFPTVSVSGEVLTASIDLNPDQYHVIRDLLTRPIGVTNNFNSGTTPTTGYGVSSLNTRNYEPFVGVDTAQGESDWVDMTEQFTALENEVDLSDNEEDEDLYF